MAVHAYESVTVAGTSTALTAATYTVASGAMITCETATVRFRLDGTAPTATVGHELHPGDVLHLSSNDEVTRARFIRRDSTSATLRATYLLE